MTKTRNFWNRLIATLWFVPTLFVVGGIFLGILLIWFDYEFGSPFRFLPVFFGVQPSGARDILAVIASSTITVAGTVFSITIVALTLASTQFSPRVLRNFMRDTGNQAVLGTLVGIFAYCIVVLRTIREGGPNPGGEFVPTTAVFFSVILALLGIGSLIYFIHHVATSIQATKIISVIAFETIKEIRSSFPTDKEQPEIDRKTEKFMAETACLQVLADKTGYVQNADTTELVELAREYDLILRMKRRIGQFSIEGLPILEIFPRKTGFVLSEELAETLRATYQISSFRTVSGDVAFGLRQIVDIAQKALSPGINDTTTALTCIDYLTAIMACLARRPSCPSYLFAEGHLRLITEHQQFEDFFDLAFNQIRQNAAGNVAVILRQLNSVNILSLINVNLPFPAERLERHELMRTMARLLYELAELTVKADTDRVTVNRYYQRIQKSLAERDEQVKSRKSEKVKK